jgi:hypothetical protein
MGLKFYISNENIENKFNSTDTSFGELLLKKILGHADKKELNVILSTLDDRYSRESFSVERFFSDYAYLPIPLSGFINRLDTIHVSYFNYQSGKIGNILEKMMEDLMLEYLEFLVIEKIWLKDSITLRLIVTNGKSLEIIQSGKF